MSIIRQPIVSSFVESIGYDHVAGVLEVEYKGGKVFRYIGVPNQTYVDLLSSDSKGKFLRKHVTGKFQTEELAEPTIL